MTKLGALVDMTFGNAFKSAEFTDSPNDVRLLRGDNIGQGRLRWDGAKRFPADRLNEVCRYELKPGDVVIAMDRPWIGAGLKYAVVRDDDLPALLVQRVARLRAKAGLDQGYLSAIIGSRAFTGYVIGVQTGSAVPHISGGQIADFEVGDLPPIDEQRSIAATLSALDDKMDSNRRASRLIEAVARTIFLQWRAAVEPAEMTRFGDFADVYGGSTPKTSEPAYWDGDLAWATPTDVTRLGAPYLFKTSRSITESGLASCAAVMHPPGTIFMTSRATIGAFAVNQVPAATNQGFIAVRPRTEAHRWFLFEEMRSRVSEFIDNANGSTFLEISRGRFRELPLSVPRATAIDALAELLQPSYANAAQLSAESEQLARVRDALLPELLSGRIRVPETAAVVQDGTG